MLKQRLVTLAVSDVATCAPDTHQLAVFHHAQQRQRQPMVLVVRHLEPQLALHQPIVAINPVAQG